MPLFVTLWLLTIWKCRCMGVWSDIILTIEKIQKWKIKTRRPHLKYFRGRMINSLVFLRSLNSEVTSSSFTHSCQLWKNKNENAGEMWCVQTYERSDSWTTVGRSPNSCRFGARYERPQLGPENFEILHFSRCLKIVISCMKHYR